MFSSWSFPSFLALVFLKRSLPGNVKSLTLADFFFFNICPHYVVYFYFAGVFDNGHCQFIKKKTDKQTTSLAWLTDSYDRPAYFTSSFL